MDEPFAKGSNDSFVARGKSLSTNKSLQSIALYKYIRARTRRVTVKSIDRRANEVLCCTFKVEQRTQFTGQTENRGINVRWMKWFRFFFHLSSWRERIFESRTQLSLGIFKYIFAYRDALKASQEITKENYSFRQIVRNESDINICDTICEKARVQSRHGAVC